MCIVVPTHADLLANVRSALYVMLGAVLCLLLVAALNLATLLSARAAARSRELAVRLALGASRGRVALQSMAEIVPLLVVGGAPASRSPPTPSARSFRWRRRRCRASKTFASASKCCWRRSPCCR